MKFGEYFEIWKCERKIGNYWKKLEIIGKKWRFRNKFGMKNDNWKYFGYLEIIWKIGINCKLGKMLGNFGKNLNKLKIWGKIGKLWEKI